MFSQRGAKRKSRRKGGTGLYAPGHRQTVDCAKLDFLVYFSDIPIPAVAA